MNKQRGAIPALVLVVILLSTLLGGMIGFTLGGGSLFSFGAGFGAIFFLLLVFWPKIRDLIEQNKKKND